MVIKKDKENIVRLKKQARKYSIKEGIFASAKTSMGDNFIAPFAIAINASNPMVAMLSSLSGLINPLTQTFSARLIERYPRKKITLLAGFLRAITWIIFVGIALMFYKGIWVGILPLFLLIFYSMYSIFVGLEHPAWFSWTGDIVPKNKRGRWFAKRNLILGIISFAVAIIASIFLDFFTKNSWIMIGFMILFFLAFICRIIARHIQRKLYEPKLKLKKGYYFSFFEFVKEAPKTNFGKFAIFRFIFAIACYISAPLIAIYLIRQLQFSYTMYMVIILSGTLFSLFFLELWGKFADKYGNYRTLIITTMMIPLVPILWVLNTNPIYLILIPSAIGGITWAGFHLAAGNFIYDNVKKQKRGLAISYYNLMLGIGIFIGASISAILIKYLTLTWIKPLIAIFILSGIIRFALVLWYVPKLKEIRHIKKYNGIKSLENLIVKEGKATLHEELHQIAHIKNYFFDD